jgi:hypothetical protein
MDALVAAGATKPMPAAYMREWPDEVATKSLAELPAYERRARELLFDACYVLEPDLREGNFLCGRAQPEKVLDVTKADDTHFDVRYAQRIEPRPNLSEIDLACGGVTKPPSDVTVRFEKQDKSWSVANSTPHLVAH